MQFLIVKKMLSVIVLVSVKKILYISVVMFSRLVKLEMKLVNR